MEIKELLFNKVDELKDKMIDDIISLVQIDSTQSEPIEDCPYGKGVRKAFNRALEICQREGLSVGDIDGHMVYGSYGSSEDYIGIIGHLDVVEVGDGWLHPPFSGYIENNRIYSRGALDNKGPLMAAFYGMLALKECGIVPKREIRVIFGGNEETGMNDIKYYLSHTKAPVMGFTPDNKFPAICGERGRAVIEVSGDTALMIEFINEYFMNAKPNGDRLGINVKDEAFGEIQIRNKVLSYHDDKLTIKFSLSTPVCDINSIIDKIKNKAEGLEVTLVSFMPWVLHNKEATLVQTLNNAFNECFDSNFPVTTTTGATYAHVCQTIIPFGPSFPGQNGIAHQPNEWMDIDDLLKCAKVYAYALYKLNLIENIETEL